MNPKVSVVMPTYNTAPYLRRAIESVLNQTFRDFEFIIVDDGSTDGSWSIVEEYRQIDSRIVMIRNDTNRGKSNAMNRGHAAARSALIAVMDSDDVCLPTRLGKQVAFMDTHSDIALVGTFMDVIDAEDRYVRTMRKPVGSERIRRMLFFHGPFANNSIMYRKANSDAIGGYREEYRYCQDVDFNFRFIYSGNRAENIPESLVRYRVHERSSLPFQKQKARLSLALKRDAIARFHLQLTPFERLSMYAHFALDMLLTGRQKQSVETAIKALCFRAG